MPVPLARRSSIELSGVLPEGDETGVSGPGTATGPDEQSAPIDGGPASVAPDHVPPASTATPPASRAAGVASRSNSLAAPLIDTSALARLAASPDSQLWAERIDRGLVRISGSSSEEMIVVRHTDEEIEQAAKRFQNSPTTLTPQPAR